MKDPDLKESFDKIERKLLLLSFKSSDLKESVNEIIEETTSLFGPIESPDDYFSLLNEMILSNNYSKFDLLKTRFRSKLITVFGELVANKFEKFTNQIKRIELKEKDSKDVFIVHGHNEKMKTTVSDFIKSLGLNPIILHEQPNQGKTIIEKFTSYSNVNFAIVLLSGDDLGYSKKDNSSNAKFRARQNVIFELGFFIGKIGRENVVALFEQIDDFEFPSDFQGVIFEPFTKNDSWKKSITAEIKLAGIDIL